MVETRKRKHADGVTSASKRVNRPVAYEIVDEEHGDASQPIACSSDDEDGEMIPKKGIPKGRKPKAEKAEKSKLKTTDFEPRQLLRAPTSDKFPLLNGGNVHIVLNPLNFKDGYFILRKQDLVQHSIFFKNLLNQEHKESRPQFSRSPHKNDIYLELLKTKGSFELVRRPIYYQKIMEDELQDHGMPDTIVADDRLYSQPDQSRPFEAFLSKSSANSTSNADNAIRIDATDDEAEVEHFTEQLHDSYRVPQKMSRSMCSLVVDSEDDSKDEFVKCQNGSKKRRSKPSSTQTEYSSSEVPRNTNFKQTGFKPQSEEATIGSKISSSYSNVSDSIDMHSQLVRASAKNHDNHDEEMITSVTGSKANNMLVVEDGAHFKSPATTSAIMGPVSIAIPLINISSSDYTAATVKSNSAIATETKSPESIPVDCGNSRAASGVTNNNMIPAPGSSNTTTLPGLEYASSSLATINSEAPLDVVGQDEMSHDRSEISNNDNYQDSGTVSPSIQDTIIDRSVFSSPPPISSPAEPSLSPYTSPPLHDSSDDGRGENDSPDPIISYDVAKDNKLNPMTSSSESISLDMSKALDRAAPLLTYSGEMFQDGSGENVCSRDPEMCHSSPVDLSISDKQQSMEGHRSLHNYDEPVQEIVESPPYAYDDGATVQKTQERNQQVNMPGALATINTTGSSGNSSGGNDGPSNSAPEFPPFSSVHNLPLSPHGGHITKPQRSLGGMDGAMDSYKLPKKTKGVASSTGLPGPGDVWFRVLAMLSHVDVSSSDAEDFMDFCDHTAEELALAHELQCMELVRSIRVKESYQYRGKAYDDFVAQHPVQMLIFSLDLQTRPLFNEAYIHVVGHCLNNERMRKAIPRHFGEYHVCPVLEKSIKQAEDMIMNINEKLLHQTLHVDGFAVSMVDHFSSFLTLAIWRQWYITKYTKLQCEPHKLGTFYKVIAKGGDTYLPVLDVIEQMQPHFPNFKRIKDWNEVKDDLNMIKNFAAQNVAPLVQCKGTGGMRSHLTFMGYDYFKDPWQESDEVE